MKKADQLDVCLIDVVCMVFLPVYSPVNVHMFVLQTVYIMYYELFNKCTCKKRSKPRASIGFESKVPTKVPAALLVHDGVGWPVFCHPPTQTTR